ncbi:hypothetical protein BD310DRAFT_314587 [Dichomitus squalens]|uniref:Uncharacterized protein n=1 Tax=Dichomitus squalens TaxID=114155 RepID=A0A4Q9PAT2_9APHY|nr:hypothetical protein BD310DRAFT_314587 [Dichomitus squalens]
MYLLEVANRGLMATITLTDEMGNLGRMAQLPLLIVKTTLNRHLSSDFKSRNVPPAAFSGSTAHESRLTALLHIVTSERPQILSIQMLTSPPPLRNHQPVPSSIPSYTT